MLQLMHLLYDFSGLKVNLVDKFFVLPDNRYIAVKSLIENNNFKSLIDIFEIVPISVVQLDLKLNYTTFRNRVLNPLTLTVKDIDGMAKLFDVKPGQLLDLAIAGIKSTKNVKKK